MARKGKCWSYIAGEPGRNWVRAFEKDPGGVLFLEWREEEVDDSGAVVARVDRRTGELVPARRRRRVSLRTRDRVLAVRKAEELAERFDELEATPVGARTDDLTLARLLTLYMEEVTPTKGEKARDFDRQAARMFRTFFGDAAIVETVRGGRPVTELGRKRYEAFIRARREGRIPGFPRKVRDRTIQADVQFMRAVFHWAMTERPDGSVLLQRNPWKGFPIPRERNPLRPPLTQELEERILEHCKQWRIRLALILCRETGRRLSAVRHIELERLNLAEGWVDWAPQYDKNRRGRRTPLTPRAVSAIREALQERGIGGRWLFPAPTDPSKPASRDYFKCALRRIKARAGIDVPWLGYHSGKRSRVRDPEFRRLDPKIREALVDTNFDTLRRIYDEVTFDDLRAAIGDR